jgi:hypothetical protein
MNVTVYNCMKLSMLNFTANPPTTLPAGSIGSHMDHGIVNALTAEIASLRSEVETRVRNTKLEQLKGADSKGLSGDKKR